MKHTYYHPVTPTSRWRLPEALPGRSILVAIWVWL